MGKLKGHATFSSRKFERKDNGKKRLKNDKNKTQI